MGIRISDEDTVFLYDSVTGLPLNIQAFRSQEHADSFLRWFLERFDRSNLLDAKLVSEVSEAWAVDCLDEDGMVTSE